MGLEPGRLGLAAAIPGHWVSPYFSLYGSFSRDEVGVALTYPRRRVAVFPRRSLPGLQRGGYCLVSPGPGFNTIIFGTKTGGGQDGNC